MGEVVKDSVAVKNVNIRNYLLHKNLGKYTMYDELLSPAIGDIYSNQERQLKAMTDGKGLLYHTHESGSKYSDDINWHYLNGQYDANETFDTKYDANKQNMFSASGNDYRKFVYTVYGHEDVPIRFINGLLAHESIEKALQMDEVGIVENISPLESMAGVVKTNINNLSGTDTPLGLLSNQLYANALYYGADFNTAREVANGADLEQTTVNYAMRYQDVNGSITNPKIITPSSVKWYGNNTENMNKLPFLFVRDKNTGRMATDHSIEVSIAHSYEDISNLNTYYLDETLANSGARYGIKKGEGYVNVTEIKGSGEDDFSELIVDYDYDNEESLIDTTYSHDGRIDGTRGRVIFDDKDYADTDAPDIIIQNQEDNEFESFRKMRDTESCNGLLQKTNDLFKMNKIKSMHGRFYNNTNIDGSDDTEATLIDTAKNGMWGNSHGRNLVRRGGGAENVNGFEDPYCRVWTYHHQYDKFNKLIRPFEKNENHDYVEDMYEANKPYRADYSKMGAGSGVTDGNTYLREHTVLRSDTGLVNITPERAEDGTVDLKRCMFSIENLAWKDVPRNERYLSKEQQGPNGGRIMWFPPYGLDFQESVSVQYETNNFIGRGEPVYTYSNTMRNGNLSFILLIDHPSVINSLHNESGNINEPNYGDDILSNDHDGNILRFFAGCEPLKYKEKVDIVTGDTIPSGTPQPQYASEYIYVFFPNNYSGNYSAQTFSSSSTPQKLRNKKSNLKEFAKGIEDEIKKSHGEYLCTDDNSFYRYLLYGKNISVDTTQEYDLSNTDGTKLFGYEMISGPMVNIISGETADYKKKPVTTGVCGVSYTTSISGAGKYDNNPELCIRPCASTQMFVKCSKESTEKDNSWNFYHRLDYDLHEKISFSSNRDLASYGLNSTLENVKQLKAGEYINGVDFSGATASFAELCCALKDSNMLNDNMGDNEKWYQYSLDCGAKKENIERLVKLFKMTDTITDIKFLGCATQQNSDTSNMLAIRRELALKGMFTKLIAQLSTGNDSDIPKATIETGFTTSKFSMLNKNLMGVNSCLASKMGKFARIEIKYRLDKYDENSGKIDETANNEEEQAIENIFNELKSNSELIQNFYEKKPDCYKIFREWFLDMMKSDGGSDDDNNKTKVIRQFISKNWKSNKWNENPTF